ncbi:MAG TPA: hypothetical protein VFN49_04395 [Candidatus Aquilonibacter sp.]|nr:hypothetical protein [Candidatus Aquilonibacter sp.]
MVQVQIGYAADGVGNGVAYARLSSRTGERLVRAAFRVPTLRDGQEVGIRARLTSYAALTALAAMLADRRIDQIAFLVPDEQLVADHNDHRDVPRPIVLPYVRLGCSLNRFKVHSLAYGFDPELTQRAQAEVSLTPAA